MRTSDKIREYHILSLGAGVQSTTVYLLAMEQKTKSDLFQVNLDAAVFADTGDEPQAVYKHLEWLESLGGPQILRRSRGRLSEALMRGENSTRQRIAAVPFFIKRPDGERGQTRRQCSKEYKVEVVGRCIRRDLIGLKPRQRMPRNIEVHQYFGISLDEARRSIGIKQRVKNAHFPLLELGWTRADCRRYLADKVPHEVPRSACVYCPFHSDAEWMRVREVPEDWALACKVDAALRREGVIVNRKMNAPMFAHSSLVPLDQVQFRHERQFNFFTTECEGMCGN